MNDHKWRKASYSSSGGGECVEVGGIAGAVLVRDTKQVHLGEARPVLCLTPSDFRRLTTTLKR